MADLDRAGNPPLPVPLCHHEQEGYRVSAIHPRYLGMENGAEVASDSFKLEIPAGVKKLPPDEVPELNDIPSLFTAKGAK